VWGRETSPFLFFLFESIFIVAHNMEQVFKTEKALDQKLHDSLHDVGCHTRIVDKNTVSCIFAEGIHKKVCTILADEPIVEDSEE
jgi:hypothetical protein